MEKEEENEIEEFKSIHDLLSEPPPEEKKSSLKEQFEDENLSCDGCGVAL